MLIFFGLSLHFFLFSLFHDKEKGNEAKKEKT